MGLVKIIDGLKTKISPLKYKFIEKYSEMRYESTHREAQIEFVENRNLRLNIVVPTINDKDVFGGVTTALKIFWNTVEELKCDVRIIALNQYEELYRGIAEKYRCGDFVKVINIDGSKIEVRKNDFFLATFWSTAIFCEKIIKQQNEKYNIDNVLFYLIQDYEPGFYPWSTEYVESESTYRMGIKTFAIFNSSLLKEYFNNLGYKFYREAYFEPILNDRLKEILLTTNMNKRKRQILVYGRPQEYRNAYTLLIDALRKLDGLLDDKACEWRVVSLGAKHNDYKFDNGLEVKSLGKVSIDEYAMYMLESYAGISLMISPHPSYPPLEMSTFGVKTITNCFANKNLSGFNVNIVCLDRFNAYEVADSLYTLISEFDNNTTNIEISTDYVTNSENLSNIVAEIVATIENKPN